MDDLETPKLHLFLVVVFLAVVAGGVVDLTLDAPRPWGSPHVLFEIGLISLSLALAVYLWSRWYRTSRSLGETRRALEERRAERDHWRESAHKLLEGLGGALDQQFTTWGLTTAEREVALLLLKGFSHKQIAARTSRSERTVRQHAIAVYRKSGLDGRAELAAFFLGDVALPGAGGA